MNEVQVVSENKFEMVLKSAMGFPGVKINREEFLRRELSKYYDEGVVTQAINKNPAQAGISIEELEKIAKSCINYETVKVTGISAVAGIPGGLAMAGTLPADTIQLFAHVIRMLQKLAYLYGWSELINEDGELDDATSNQITLFIGVMFGVGGANIALGKLAKVMAENIPKQLMRQALTKGTIYPIVKSVATKLGFKMTKAVFAKGAGKAIPIVGAVASGGITYAVFKPMSKRLKSYLETLPTASVEHYQKPKPENTVFDIDFTDIVINEVDES